MKPETEPDFVYFIIAAMESPAMKVPVYLQNRVFVGSITMPLLEPGTRMVSVPICWPMSRAPAGTTAISPVRHCVDFGVDWDADGPALTLLNASDVSEMDLVRAGFVRAPGACARALKGALKSS